MHIARQDRPKLYDFFARRPDPLIPRHLRFEVCERILSSGEIQTPLDESGVRAVADTIVKLDIGVVAVCYLHAYTNAAHEQRTREILLSVSPELRVCLSSEVLPEYKEYERMSTTAINAYVMPIVEQYVRRVCDGITAKKVQSPLHIMQSNAGIMTSRAATHRSIHTILSTP